jgi:hypothetical protein
MADHRSPVSSGADLTCGKEFADDDEDVNERSPGKVTLKPSGRRSPRLSH